jgi:pyruvate/2-oxoglutarate dehydrogenase complex dihydrolipoamide acyltransferase (E2) component
VSSSSTDTLVAVTMPQMGVSMAEGTVAAWHKRTGDWVNADETICEISTDKIDSEVPAPAAGRAAEILVEVEQTVPVGTVLARIATDALAGGPHPDEHMDAPAEAASDTDSDTSPAEPHPAAAAGDPAGQAAPAPPSNGERRVYSPVVQRIAASEGIDLTKVPGTGRGGRVSKQDVLAFIANAPHESTMSDPAATPQAEPSAIPPSEPSARPLSEPAPPPRDETGATPPSEPPLHIESPYREAAPNGDAEEPKRLSRMRRSIAEHMVRSLQTAATCTSIIEADFTGIEAARRPLGLKHLPFVARSVIDALRVHGDLNATLEGETLTRHRAVHLGIAVSLGEDGLIVPVIHDAHELAPEGLARRISELAARARSGQLTPDDVQGATFTITNPGGFGTLASTPIINQPQVAILDLEAVVKRAVVVTDDAGNDSIAIRPMAYVCLSWDHRALDGALAAQFLSTLRTRIESWGAR